MNYIIISTRTKNGFTATAIEVTVDGELKSVLATTVERPSRNSAKIDLGYTMGEEGHTRIPAQGTWRVE